MAKKIEKTKNDFKNFIRIHKIIFTLLVVCAFVFLCIPFLFQRIMAVEEPINLKLKDPALENSLDNPYIIDSTDDFITLQEYSKTHDCYGMYFAVGDELKNNRLTWSEEEGDEEGSESGGITYNLNLVGTIVLEDGTRTEFKGIGQNFNLPFRGNILFNGITIRIDTPLFCYMASGAEVKELHLFGKIITDKFNSIVGKNATLGALSGMVILDGEKPVNISTVSISHNTSIVGTTKSVGGLIGMVMGNPKNSKTNYEGNNVVSAAAQYELNLDKITVPDEISLLSTGYLANNVCYYSQLSGNGTLQDNYPGYTGGIIGDVSSCNQSYYVNVNFTGTTLVNGTINNTKSGSGGVIGHIADKVRVKFDGDIDVSGLTRVNGVHDVYHKGYVIGSMRPGAVAYMTEGRTISKPTIGDLETLNEVDVDNTANLIAGNIFKNTKGEFFDNTVCIAGEGTKDNPYIISNEEDMEKLAVFLTTKGVYGTWYIGTNNYGSWFSVPEGKQTSIANILNYVRKASFLITGDIDLSAKEIIRLNREGGAAFGGSIIGQQGTYADGLTYPTLYQNTDTYQGGVALIPYATGNVENGVSVPCEFKDFNLAGTIKGRQNVHGLICNMVQSNTEYSSYVFENINMKLDIESKILNNSGISGLIGSADLRNVKNINLQEAITITFNNISYNGSIITNSNGSSNGGALMGTFTMPGNDMDTTEDVNRCEVIVNNYDFMGEIKSSSAKSLQVTPFIYSMTYANAVSYSLNVIAGIDVNVYKKGKLTVDGVNIHDSSIVSGESNTGSSIGGFLGYSWNTIDVSLKNIVLKNINYDVACGAGGILLYSSSSNITVDGLNYDNVNLIRSNKATQGYWQATMVYSNSGVFILKNYSMNDCYIKSYSAKPYFAEIGCVTGNGGTNNTTYRATRQMFSLEGNDADGNKYTAVNSYKRSWKYTDIDTGTQDYSASSQVGAGEVQYNVESDMEGKYIYGKGTAEDPFIIDDEAKMVIFSDVNSSTFNNMDYYFKYFSDIEEILSEEEKLSLTFIQKKAKYMDRILTGQYVFAKSMDLTEYSYYPAWCCTGKYYGFDAYAYSGKASLTKEELKTLCSNAIKILENKTAIGAMTLENVNDNKPEIHFGADKVAGGIMGSGQTSGDNYLRPSSNIGIHKDMQCALFSQITGVTLNGYTRGQVTINNLKLSGVVGSANTNTTYGGGAVLISGGPTYAAVYKAEVNISNIDFGKTYIVQRQLTASSWDHGSGLLIDTINNGKVNITGVKILKEEAASAVPKADIRADALIGYQYGTSSKVIFRDIDLNAVIDPGTLTREGDTVTIETSEKEGAWRTAGTPEYEEYGYGFRYGYYYFHLKEGAAIYWYDVGEDIVTPGRFDGNDRQTIQNKLLLKNVQKYAYKIVNVDVNPESANITKGSGTKEDPYIINKVGQLTTLANFIKYKGDVIGYDTWYVGETDGTGYDETDADTWADESNLLYKYRKISETEDNRIKAVEQLTKSYYKIVEDIDFSDPNSAFRTAAENFNGIGISDYPFSGAFIGEKKADGNYPSIIFGNSTENYQNTFGLIQYGKGFNVSNLNFEQGCKYNEIIDELTGDSTFAKTDEMSYIYLNTSNVSAGMVASYIVGGDNIIDNVGVSTQIQVKGQPGANNFMLGGYVGSMQKGTLTVSGITEETFENFRIGAGSTMTDIQYEGSTTYVNNTRYISALVGRLYTGYIVYKDKENGLTKDTISIDTVRIVTPDADGNNVCRVEDIHYYNKYGVGCSRNFNPINQAYLDSVERIKVVKDEREDSKGTLICEIENEDQLFVYALALSSGALSSSTSTSTVVPYNQAAACKKTEEEFADWLANENAGRDEASKIVFSEDYDFPAVFKYFDFTALENSYHDTVYDGYSMLNQMNAVYKNDGVHRTTWMLTNEDENFVYDMGKFGSAFTGIGVRVDEFFNVDADWDKASYTSMCANFDGNGHTIRTEMKKNGTTGLFTALCTNNNGNTKVPFVIGNFTLTGRVEQYALSGSYLYAGGVVGYYRNGAFLFDGITLKDFKVVNHSENSTGNTGGIIGACVIHNSIYLKFSNINIGDKDWKDSECVVIDNSSTSGNAAGGLIGSTVRLIKAENINVAKSVIRTKGGAGFIANIVDSNSSSNDTYINHVSVTDCVIETASQTSGVGAVIGSYTNNAALGSSFVMAIHDINVKDNRLIAPENNNRVGKIVGYHSGVGKKEILKLTDKDSDNFTGTTSDVIWNCETPEDESCYYIYHNDFCELEKAEELYGIDREAVDENGMPVVRYSECLEQDMFTLPDNDGDGEPEPVDLITSTEAMDNSIIKWSSDSGTLENVINSVLSTLTNGTGLLNDGVNDVITVSVEPLQIKDGVVSAREDGSETIAINKIDGNFVVTNNNKFDSFEKDDKPGTFSLLHITYKIGETTTYSEEITIPIFISNMINVDIYSKIKIGQEYDIDVMRAIERSASDIQVTTKDSSYTIYTEYMYSSNRIEFDEELYMNKGFRLYEAPDPYIPLGTKLTLIDLTFDDNPHTYYYEVTGQTTFVPLSEFKDENGNFYKERNINLLSELPQYNSYTTMYVNGRTFKKYNRGVEKYLLFVDCTKVEQVGNESSLSPFIIDGVPGGQTEIQNKEVFYTKYRTYNTLSTYNGRRIGFIEDSVITEGEINKDKQLRVKASFSDTASDFYWSNIKPYDYNNQGKYLEVAVYLKNENGDKVMLPSGTRIKFAGSDKMFESVKNTSSIFYYKDGVDTTGYSLMSKTENTTTSIEFLLDFTYAKMENLPSGAYTVGFELVRTPNKDYPMGDDIVDYIESDIIDVTANAEYGFRLDTKGKDTLAFNLADVTEGTVSEVDFDILINSTLPKELAEKKKAVVKFSLMKKDKDTGIYLPYLDTAEAQLTDIGLSLDYNSNLSETLLNEGDFEYVINGIAGKDSEPVLLSCKLKLPYEVDINNYKLKAELYIDGDKRASDFFIVNIANIVH